MKLLNFKEKVNKVFIKSIMTSFIYIIIIFMLIYLFFSDSISTAFSMIDIVSIKDNKQIITELKINPKTKRLENNPEYGKKYGQIKISSINIDLPLYYGNTISILKYGIGQTTRSYCPGEGGSIICQGHNTEKMLKKLPKINKSDKIVIDTSYGSYTYSVYDTKIVSQNEKEEDITPIQRENEILMIYTKYPIDNIGSTSQYFIAYAKLVNNK